MVRRVFLALLLLISCNPKINCENSDQCKKEARCINDGEYHCLTGCAEICRKEGLCTAIREDGATRCIAAKHSDCKESDVCIYYGRCTPNSFICVARNDLDCEKSFHCNWFGRCSLINNECLPRNNYDCGKSFDCKMYGKCFKKYERGKCVTASEFESN